MSSTGFFPIRLPSLKLKAKALNLCAVFLWCASMPVDAAEITVSVDPTQPGPVISPYIYGQFIEHLGRCIHDGVWSEKLNDRKFLQPLDKSAWKVASAPGGDFEAFMDTAGAYAGEHCLAMWRLKAGEAVCGVYQTNIGVLSGKEYLGYAYVSVVSGEPKLNAVLSWGDDEQAVPLAIAKKDGYQRVPFRFKGGGTTENGKFSLNLGGTGMVWIGAVSLMPADNVKGMRADVLALIKKINSPIMRWPGGNFVSGYNWKDGIGPRDRRPPRWERAWNDVEDNDFGMDEFMAFCEEVNTEPYIAVNTGLGSVIDAAAEVEYVTGSEKTHWGAERARNGHSKPYQVTWWGVGNEMFGDWQLGNVPAQRYALRHNAFVTAMKQAKPDIKIIGVGAPGKWNDVIVPLSASHMNLLSGHHYTQRHLIAPFTPEDESKYIQNFPSYSADVMHGVRNIIADFRPRLGSGDPAIAKLRLAIDEWGIVRNWNSAPDRPGFGAFEHYYPLGDAVACARAVHEIIRCADVVEMANWAQTVNVIGAIKTSHNHAALDPVGHLLALYRGNLEGHLVPVKFEGSEAIDVVAAMDKKAKVVSLGLVNFSADKEQTVRFSTGKTLAGDATGWRIHGPKISAINIPGEPESVTTKALGKVDLDQGVVLPPYSITVLRVSAR